MKIIFREINYRGREINGKKNERNGGNMYNEWFFFNDISLNISGKKQYTFIWTINNRNKIETALIVLKMI